MIDGYLLGRKSLRLVFVLVDAEVGPTALDVQMIDWLRAKELPCRVVATKADKVKPSRQLAQRKEVAGKLGLLPQDIVWASSAKGGGIADFRREIANVLEI
jgi:GTP-binding protein